MNLDRTDDETRESIHCTVRATARKFAKRLGRIKERQTER